MTMIIMPAPSIWSSHTGTVLKRQETKYLTGFTVRPVAEVQSLSCKENMRCTVNLLKFSTLRQRQTAHTHISCSWRNSLIRVFPVFYFCILWLPALVTSILFMNRKRKVFKFLKQNSLVTTKGAEFPKWNETVTVDDHLLAISYNK